jgi:hypothetical protein
MTTWAVVKDDTGEKRGRGLTPWFLPRLALLACIAAVVVSLGVALTPGGPEQPVEPPFSEQARAAAFADTMRLRAAAEQLSGPAAGAAQASLPQTVTLLTTQARALLVPGQGGSASLLPRTPSAAASPAAPPLTSEAALATELAASASQRLADAAAADGGMARLLAAVGTGQLLQASTLAAAAGAQLPAQADAVPLPSAAACAMSPSPAGTAGTGARASGAAGGTVSLEAALAAAVRTERQSVYGYQLALTRLGGDPAKAAAEQLGRHKELSRGAETLSRKHCSTPAPEDAGYTADESFLVAPAAGLAALETGALPVYGDLVALSDGDTRKWAISALLGTARRAALWGAEPGPVPGVALDASLPPLPLPPSSPGPSPVG